MLPAQDDPRNAAELVGQVQRVVEQGATPPVIVVDGLDEARAHTFAITEELLLRLAPYAVVIVSTRERRRGETEPSLLDVLTAGTPELDLDLPAAQERGRADMRGYIAWRLTDVDLAMDPDAVAGYLAGTASMTGSSPFLLARLVTDQLRAAPVDTAQPDWQDMVSHSVEDALDTDLAHVRALDGASGLASQSARILLAALTWGFGAGLPEEEWLVCANATSGGGFGSADVSWILDELGRYIIQDGEAGVAVYRIAHQSLADHIRPPFMASHQQTFDPQALPIAKALLERYETLLASGISASGPEYLWRYAWRHAAAAGLDGLDLLRALAVREDALLPDIALAAQEVGGRLADWGYRMEAVDPAEEAAQLYQELAAANPAFLPDLAGALNNLGIRYREVGRRQDALPPAEEAVQLYRELAAANPAFLPDLAMALNNLGVCYSELGRRQDALAPAEEAVQLRRELAAANPAFLPDLASVLNNLGIRYSELGRRQDALPPAEEAVQLDRELAAANPAFLPDLAGALNNLGIRYREVGRRQDALAPAEEAVQLRRELAAANPAFLPDLATSMNNLGNRFSEAGTPARGDAIWEQAITEAAPSAGAYLLVARASGTEPGNAKVAGWLVRSLALDSENRDLQGSVHELARRHRVPDPAAFDENWARHTGRPVPAWLTVDPVLLAAARAWVATDTYTAERDYLADHLELLEPDADIAVAEALLVVTEQAAGRYSALRQVAQRDGVAAAYQPLLLTILAREFTTADPHRQRELLVGRRDDLLSETVASALNELADQEGEIAILSQRASALLALARTGDDGLAFEALDEPGRFPALLHTLATQAEAGSLAPAAIAAYTIAATNAEAAAAMFYLAVGGVIQGNRDGAADLVKQARTADPDQVPSWINELAGIGQHHPGVLPLISMLTAPAAESSGDSE